MKTLIKPFRALAHRLERKVGKHVVRDKFRDRATDKKTLDLGCGDSPLLEAFPNRVGVDVVRGDGVQVIADAHALPFASHAFEQLVCSEVLEHLADPSRAASEMARVLKKGGKLALSTPFVYPLHEAPYDFQRFTAYGLDALFRAAGFAQCAIEPLFNEEQTLAILIQRIAYQRQDSRRWHYLYLLAAHALYRLAPRRNSPRFQDVNRRMSGHFMTAGYFLSAVRRDF